MLLTRRLYLGQGTHEQRLCIEKDDHTGRKDRHSRVLQPHPSLQAYASTTLRCGKGRTAAGQRSGLDREAAATRGLCAISLSLGQASERGPARVYALSNKDVTWPGALLSPSLGEEGWQWRLGRASREYSIVPSDYAKGRYLPAALSHLERGAGFLIDRQAAST